MSDPEWLGEGASVVELATHNATSKGTGTIRGTVVERLTKRDVVLANGNRYNRRRLSKQTGTWSPTWHLLPPDDERVARVAEANRQSRLLADIDTTHAAFRKAPTIDTAEALFGAVETWIANQPEVARDV